VLANREPPHVCRCCRIRCRRLDPSARIGRGVRTGHAPAETAAGGVLTCPVWCRPGQFRPDRAKRESPLPLRRLPLAVVLLALSGAACSAQPGTTTTVPTDTSTATPTAAATTTQPTNTARRSAGRSRDYSLGGFPDFPPGHLPDAAAAALQTVLDAAVSRGTFAGITAAVIVADEGSWTGAAGSWADTSTNPGRHPTHSSAKTVVAAEVLRLAEEGKLALDDPAADHLPPELGFFDANGATIRQVLAMRSGIPSLHGDIDYPAELAPSVVDVFRMLPESDVPPDSRTEYASTNYVLLGSIIEYATRLSLAEALRSSVLADPALVDLVYTAGGALASDGWGVETTAAALARWGYELYGGSVLSEASLREMTDFQGQWYGLGVMDLSSEYGELAVGHQGLSSPGTCCSAIVLVAVPAQGIVISVQADTTGTPASADTNSQVDRLAVALREAIHQ
jgi:CubicO group peptidase (beta-lactamase class C family)